MKTLFRSKLQNKMKRGIVTGGSRGLGLALANELLSQQIEVAIWARDKAELQSAEQILRERFPLCKLISAVCDVTNEEQVNKAFSECQDQLGEIDFWINNAGAILVGPFESLERKDFAAQMDLHLYAVIHSTRLMAQYCRDRGIHGRIVNICSMGGKVAVPHMLAYDASKFALAGFSLGVAAELARNKISVTTVFPALMQTGSPIQAVFKGDAEKEFAWFAMGDAMPGLSLPAASAAKRIVRAAERRQAELIPSLPGRLRLIAGVLFPETVAIAMAMLAQFLPTGQSKQHKTGAESQAILSKAPILRYFRERLKKAELQLNQKPRHDAEFNLGLK